MNPRDNLLLEWCLFLTALACFAMLLFYVFAGWWRGVLIMAICGGWNAANLVALQRKRRVAK